MLFNRFIQTMQNKLCFLSIQSNLKKFFILCSSLLDWTCKERFSSLETLKLAFGKLSWESHCEGGATTNSSMKTSKETISNKVVLHWKAACIVQIEFSCLTVSVRLYFNHVSSENNSKTNKINHFIMIYYYSCTFFVAKIWNCFKIYFCHFQSLSDNFRVKFIDFKSQCQKNPISVLRKRNVLSIRLMHLSLKIFFYF